MHIPQRLHFNFPVPKPPTQTQSFSFPFGRHLSPFLRCLYPPHLSLPPPSRHTGLFFCLLFLSCLGNLALGLQVTVLSAFLPSHLVLPPEMWGIASLTPFLLPTYTWTELWSESEKGQGLSWKKPTEPRWLLHKPEAKLLSSSSFQGALG